MLRKLKYSHMEVKIFTISSYWSLKETDFIENSCKACGSTEDGNSCVEVIVTNENTSCTCPTSGNLLGSPKIKKGK